MTLKADAQNIFTPKEWSIIKSCLIERTSYWTHVVEDLTAEDRVKDICRKELEVTRKLLGKLHDMGVHE